MESEIDYAEGRRDGSPTTRDASLAERMVQETEFLRSFHYNEEWLFGCPASTRLSHAKERVFAYPERCATCLYASIAQREGTNITMAPRLAGAVIFQGASIGSQPPADRFSGVSVARGQFSCGARPM